MKQIDRYTSLRLEDYKGTFSIIEGFEKDGEFKHRWIKEEIGKDKELKNMPKRVKLGDKAKAIEVCLWLYEELTGQPMGTDYKPQTIDDPPF